MTYDPDSWVILKIPEGYKVLGGWSGGYLDGDNWRMNSGITSVEVKGDYYMFYGASGSCYKCHKDGYGLRMSTAGVYNKLTEAYPDDVMLMEEDTDWLNVDFSVPFV